MVHNASHVPQVERGNREVVEELIRAGASVDCQDEVSGKREGKSTSTEVSIGKPSQEDIIHTHTHTHTLQDGLTALMRAASAGNLQMVQAILAAGAITDLRDKVRGITGYL